MEPTKYQILLFAGFVLLSLYLIVLLFFSGVKKVNASADPYADEFPGLSASREADHG